MTASSRIRGTGLGALREDHDLRGDLVGHSDFAREVGDVFAERNLLRTHGLSDPRGVRAEFAEGVAEGAPTKIRSAWDLMQLGAICGRR